MEGFDYHKSCACVCTCVPLSVYVLTAKPDFPTTGCTGSTVGEYQRLGFLSKGNIFDAVTLAEKYIKNWCEKKWCRKSKSV